MLDLILDGECHNGQRSQRLGNNHWRFEARGDDGHYCYYFHCTLHAQDEGEVTLDVVPDADLLPASAESFRRHRPESLWISRGRAWTRHPVAGDGTDDVVRVRIWMEAGETVSVSRMHPYPYSAILARLGKLASHVETRQTSLGRSAEGHEIAAIEIGTGLERLLVLAGQHPAEFGGTEAALGIADWLLSRLPEPRALLDRHTVTVVPCLNPDGNIGGRCGHNARGQDLYRSFPDAARGATPEAPEAACLWRWAEEHRPALALNFHTYTQPSPGGSFPWEGIYTPPDEAFADAAARDRQRTLDDRLAWETDGLSHSGAFATHAPASFECQLAALGIPSVFYEVQDAVGPFRHRRTGVHVLRTALSLIG
jgi:hypothetical protein